MFEIFTFLQYAKNHSGPENLKKSRPKNSWNEINQFQRIFFDVFWLSESELLIFIENVQKIFSWNCLFRSFIFFPGWKIDFCPFLKWQNMEFGEKKFFREIDLFDFTSFLAWTFLDFVANCGIFSVSNFTMGQKN